MAAALGTSLEPEPEAAHDEAIIQRLAGLSLLDYDRQREAQAKAMGVRASTLDKLVAASRRPDAEGGIDFETVEPWEAAVDPATLLDGLATVVERFIVCPQETAQAALWCAMSWLIDTVNVAPLAVITAPEKRCGKSQLLFLLGKLVCKPLVASNISPSAVFRAMDAWKPTLLVDEADAFMRENEELRGILNAGHTRDSAYVVRVVGEDLTPKKFNVWGAKALAGIGHLAGTLMDRAIVLELRRKLPHEAVDRLRHAEPGLFDDLAAKLARFAMDYRDAIRLARPELPAKLNDRAQDNWDPLLAIADTAGGHWPQSARRAALRLSGSGDDGKSVGAELLEDIRAVFEGQRVDKISSADLVAALVEDEEAPWATYNRGRPISPRQVSARLKEYAIFSKTIRQGLSTAKGFEREQFDDAFSRYLALPPSTPLPSVTSSQSYSHAASSVTDRKTHPSHADSSVTTSQTGAAPDMAAKRDDVTYHPSRYGSENGKVTLEPAPHKGCDDVTYREGVGGEVEL